MWFLVDLSIPKNPVSNPAYGLEYKYCYLKSLTNRADCIFIHFSDWTLKDVHYIVLLSVQSIISKYLCFTIKVNFFGQPVIRMWFLFFHVMEAGNLKNWVLCLLFYPLPPPLLANFSLSKYLFGAKIPFRYSSARPGIVPPPKKSDKISLWAMCQFWWLP